MAWDLILWLLFFLINLSLLASTLYQIISLSDLEADYINPFELSSRVNVIIVPEFILQAVYSALLLLTGHWMMFLVTVPVNYYNLMLYMKQKHIIDVTEVFRILNDEKKIRMVKFAFYLLLFCLVMVRVILSVFNTLVDEEDVVHLF